MLNIAIFIIVLIALIVSGFFVFALIEIRKAASQAAASLKSIECSLNETLKQTNEAMADIKTVIDNVSSITDDAKSLSSSLRDTAGNIKHLSEDIESVASLTSVKFTALKVGVRAAFHAIFKHLINRKGG